MKTNILFSNRNFSFFRVHGKHLYMVMRDWFFFFFIQCPKLITLNKTSGVITSPFYPRYYHPNHACGWQITAKKGNRVKLVIDFMSIVVCGAACTCDYLEIQTGFSADGAPSGRICGSLIGSVTYYSYLESLKVLFVSDNNIRLWRFGFRASYTQLNYTALTGT